MGNKKYKEVKHQYIQQLTKHKRNTMAIYMGSNKQMGGQMRAMATNEVNYGDKQGTQQTGRKHTGNM